MKQIIGIAAFATLFTSGFAIADSSQKAEAKPIATTPAAAPMTEAEVRKVDKEQGKITLRHGEIKNLDMPPMTMVFRVKEAKQLDQIKEGDQVRFTADKIGGQYTVTGIEKK